MIERVSLEEKNRLDHIIGVVYERLIACYQIPSIRDKIVYLCDTLKLLTRASAVYLVDYESKNYFSFFDTKSYQKHLHFFGCWVSTLRKQKKVFLSKEAKKSLPDYIFLKRNHLDNIYVLPIFYEENLIGVITLENINTELEHVEKSVDMLLAIINEQFEKFANLNINISFSGSEHSPSRSTTIKVMMNKSLTILEALPEFYEMLHTNKIDFFKATRGNLIQMFDLIDVEHILSLKEESKSHHSIQKIHLASGAKIYIYVCLTLTGTKSQNNDVAELVCVDITETKSACDVLIAEGLLRKSIVTINQPGHLLLSITNKIMPLYISKNAKGILNLSDRELANPIDLLSLFREGEAHRYIEILNKTDLDSNTTEWTVGLKDSNRLVNCAFRKVVGGADDVYFATIMDVSDMKLTFHEAKTYKQMPGFIAKFAVTHKLKLIEASEGFFDFLGLDMANCNNFLFPPVFKRDVRLVHANIKKMRTGKPLSFDFRAKNKEGKVCWLHLEANCIGVMDVYPIYLALFIDITKQRHLELDLEEKQARYDLIDEDDKEVFFEYDISNDVYHGPLYGNYEGAEECKYGIVEQYMDKFLKVHEHLDAGLRNWLNMLCGIYSKPFFIQYFYVHDYKKKVAQIRVEATVIYDGDTPVKVLGKIHDINKDYDSKSAIQIDGITNLYSRSYGEQVIKEYLRNHSVLNYLLLIDIDEFKAINDAYGYMFGNVVLGEFSELLLQISPKDAVLYRLKEDDFVVFIKDCTIRSAKMIANRVCEQIKNIYMGEDESIQLSCSVGIARLKYDGDFETALHQAEAMVDQVKNCGKGFSAVYDHFEKTGQSEDQTTYLFDSKVPHAYLNHEKDVLFFAYEILEKTKNIRNAINLLLHRTGKQLNLKSIVILQTKVLEDKFAFHYWWQHQTSYSHILSLLEEFKFEIQTCCDTNFGEMTQIVRYERNIAEIMVCTTSTQKEEIIILEPLDSKQSWTIEEQELILELSKIILTHIKKARVYSLSKEKSKFLSKMSHEIRTPLNIIIGMANLAKNVKSDEKTVDKYLQNIDFSAKYLLNLVNNLLEMNRIESGKIVLCEDIFELGSYLENLRNIMEIQGNDKNINYQCTMKVIHNQLIGDTVRLNQVLINILGNAIKFTPEYGFVSLEVTEVDSVDDQAYLKFSIKDSGIGIKEDKLASIFTPFEQECKEISRKYGGTGLGLSISSSIVNMMGGTIHVNSKVNHGSEFFFTIPLGIYKGNEILDERKPVNVHLHGKRILVAEDNTLNAEIVKTILEDVGAIVEVTGDGLEVIEAFSSNQPGHYDVILMDVSMPIMDGLEATMEIRKLERYDAESVPIIAMTANAFPEDIAQCFESGMNGHVAKPFDLDKLYSELSRVLQ